MASLKTDAKQNERSVMNTTINSEILKNFKAYCKEIGYPMNLLLDVFMEQFTNGELCLKIGKNNKVEVDINDNNNTDNE